MKAVIKNGKVIGYISKNGSIEIHESKDYPEEWLLTIKGLGRWGDLLGVKKTAPIEQIKKAVRSLLVQRIYMGKMMLDELEE